jgi:hypothetical protein
MSRTCLGLAVASSVQSATRGPLDPFPHERRSNTASLTAWSARMTAPDGRVRRKSRGMTAT